MRNRLRKKQLGSLFADDSQYDSHILKVACQIDLPLFW